MEDISGLYVIVAVLVAVIDRIDDSKVCVDFLHGTTTVISAVIAIGVAWAVCLLMAQAKTVYAIIRFLATIFDGKSPFVIAFHFFAVSASGKAFILFPSCGTLAAALELGGITYQQWLKYAGKTVLTLTAVGLGFAIVAQVVHLA